MNPFIKVSKHNTSKKQSLCDDRSHFKIQKSTILLQTQVYSKRELEIEGPGDEEYTVA